MTKKKTIIALAVVLALALITGLCYARFAPKGSEGAKEITVSVTHGDGSTKTFPIETDSKNLRGALEEQALISGDDSGETLFVLQVDGEMADSSVQEWWCFTKGGEMLPTGVDDTLIADGDTYEITLTTGYDH